MPLGPRKCSGLAASAFWQFSGLSLTLGCLVFSFISGSRAFGVGRCTFLQS